MTDTNKPETALVLRRDLLPTKFIVANEKALESIIKAASKYSWLGIVAPVFPMFGAVVAITPYALKLINNALQK